MIMCVLLCYPVSIHMSQLLSTGRPISSFTLDTPLWCMQALNSTLGIPLWCKQALNSTLGTPL